MKKKIKDNNDLVYLNDAALNGDQQAAETILQVNALNVEKDVIWREVSDAHCKTPRTTRPTDQEYAALYDYVLPRLDRIREIEAEKFRLIHDVFRLERKKPLIYLETLKRKRKEEIILERNNHEKNTN